MNRVVEIDAADTHELRRAVLRDGAPDAVVDWSGDRDGTTVHLGVSDDAGAVIAVSTWLWTPCPLHPAEPAVRLRGMATDPAHRGAGLGSLLLAAGVARSFGIGRTSSTRRASEVELVWANARVEAIGFYEHHAWLATGPVFQTAETDLPHRLVTRRSAPVRR